MGDYRNSVGTDIGYSCPSMLHSKDLGNKPGCEGWGKNKQISGQEILHYGIDPPGFLSTVPHPVGIPRRLAGELVGEGGRHSNSPHQDSGTARDENR